MSHCLGQLVTYITTDLLKQFTSKTLKTGQSAIQAMETKGLLFGEELVWWSFILNKPQLFPF